MNIINLSEDPQFEQYAYTWVGDFHSYLFRLVDSNGTAVPLTGGTLAITYTNVYTGAAYTFPSGTSTLTPQYATEGLLTLGLPSAFPTVGNVRVTVTLTVGAVVRRFGPLYFYVQQP